jgi:hypothetical protein
VGDARAASRETCFHLIGDMGEVDCQLQAVRK